MAPTAPKKRPSIRSKASTTTSSIHAPPAHRASAIISDSFINSKRDNRVIKSSAFLNRIEKTHKKPLKRRRPSKKLVATLDSLVDALPDVEELVRDNERGQGKMKMLSLKSKPGARKRKEKLEKMERERFGKNMAVILGGTGVQGKKEEEKMAVDGADGVDPGRAVQMEAAVSNPAVNRFAALRTWISANMEKHPAFEEKK